MSDYLDYESFGRAVVDVIRQNNAWHRVVCIDLETKVEGGNFLAGERLLAVGLARRNAGQIEVKTLRLEEESDEAEFALLERLAEQLALMRPLVLLGYNISGYDFPFLILKMKKYDEYLKAKAVQEGREKAAYSKAYWAFKDALTRAYILDVMHPLRFEVAKHDRQAAREALMKAGFACSEDGIGLRIAGGASRIDEIKSALSASGVEVREKNVRADGSNAIAFIPPLHISLAKVVAHPRFAGLALRRLKHLADGPTKEDKGRIIYEMWKSNNPDFERYLEADVYDTLLLAEEVFGIGDG